MRKSICNSALIFTVLVVFIFAGISFVLAFDDCAYAETETYFSAERYTDSDFLLNSDGSESNKTIADFAYEVKYTPNENPITELACVIPLQYLESQEEEAVFFYNGKEYGFYISKHGDCFDTLLIDFVFDLTENQSDLEYKIKIKPLLEQCFKRRLNNNGSYEWHKWNNMSYTYFVANPRFAVALFNENSLNYGDEGYSKYADDGLIINQYRVNYSKVIKNTGDSTIFFKSFGGKVLFDLSCVGLDAITMGIGGKLTNILGHAADSASQVADIKDTVVLADNENNITTNMSKFEQQNDKEFSGYTRFAYFAPDDDNMVLSSTENSYAEFIVTLNNADYKSRILQVCDFDIVRRNLSGPAEKVTGAYEDEAFSFSKETILNDEKYLPKFEIDGENFDEETVPIYLLPRGKQKINFTPKYSGVYNFTLPLYTSLTINGTTDNKFSLQANQTYKLEITGTANEKIMGGLTCFLESYDANAQYLIPTNSSIMLSYFPEDSGYKEVKALNGNAKIGLLDENKNLLVAANGNSFNYNFILARKYYFIISNGSTEALQTRIIINTLNEMSLGSSLSVSNNQAVYFVNHYTEPVYYKLTLDNGTAVSATVTDKFNRVISCEFETKGTSAIYTFLLSANETYYLRFTGDLTVGVSAVITVNPTRCVWKIGGNAVQESVVRLKPNSSYAIEMEMFANDVKIETVRSFICYAEGIDCFQPEGQMNIGSAKNNERIILVPRIAPDFGLTIVVDDMIRNVKLMKCDGTQNYSNVKFELNKPMQGITKPVRTGYAFKGYYTQPNGQGKQYVDENMNGGVWDIDAGNSTLYAHWEIIYYTLTYHIENEYGSHENKLSITYDEILPSIYKFAPELNGHEFVGYFTEPNGQGKQLYRMEIINDAQGAALQGVDYYWVEGMIPIGRYDFDRDVTIYAYFVPLKCTYTYENFAINGENYEYICSNSISLTHGVTFKLNPMEIDGYTFDHFNIRYRGNIADVPVSYIPDLYRSTGDGKVYPRNYIIGYYSSQCIAQGALITLADGTQVPVESLKGDETLLVWNMLTGRYDSSRILFIDKDSARMYKVINLGFSDGTIVKVISEHGFWDYDLNKYVYLDSNASKYVGHWFNKGENRVQLTSVDVRDEYTTAYSPVTYAHLCYYVNGMLSMPGGIDGMFNIFDVDPSTMTIDAEAMARDISLYGLYTYEEFAEIVPVSEDIFKAFNGEYLKVAVGKGMITVEQLNDLVCRYSKYF